MMKTTIRRVVMATSQYLANVFTRHQVYLERYKKSLINEFDPTIQKVDRELRKALQGAGVALVSDLTYKQLQKLVDKIRKIEADILGDYSKKVMRDIKNFSAYEAQFAEKAISDAIVGGYAVKRTKAADAWLAAQVQPVQATGQLLESFIATWSASQVAAAEAVIRNAHAQGWATAQAVTAIRGTKKNGYKDGILAKTQRDTETLVRTATQHVSNAARMAVYQANDDIVEAYRWISTLDSSTTQQCRSLDQRVFKLGKGPIPPLHPNCRSTTIPELKGVDLVGAKGFKRPSIGDDGPEEQSGGLTYYTWLKSQPASFQNSAIGPTRAKLLRDGGLTADAFARLNIGRDFQPLTLVEMRALAPEAFSKAGI
jgi:SPP1 gp7 family putative phage head morphogenesis protein